MWQLALITIPAFSDARAVIWGGGKLAAGHLSSSVNTQLDFCACAPASYGSYADSMFEIYAAVMARGLPNFLSAKCPIPSNFNVDKWVNLVLTDADNATIAFKKYGSLASYQGPIPTPFDKNTHTHLPLINPVMSEGT